jgi:Flp pilus assembly pilin Flp
MRLFEMFRRFREDEAGAVTVDWVVLTAAIVGFAIAVLATVQGGMEDLGTAISDSMSNAGVADLGTLGWTAQETQESQE